MKIARITNDGTLMLKGEVIEYPTELEGGSLKNNGNLFVSELIEKEVITNYFEDTFDSGERSGEWQIERWGASPNNIVEEPFEDGWRFRQTTGGHASIAMFKQLPNITKGKLIIEFDWQPYGANGNYRGAFVNVRGAVNSRTTTYGRGTYENLMLQFDAYSYNPPLLKRDNSVLGSNYAITPTDEKGHYRIEICVDSGEIYIYNNTILVAEYNSNRYREGMFLEFAYGSFSQGVYSFVDNVTISIEEEQADPLMRISNIFKMTINKLIENYDFIFKPLSMEGIQAYFDASVLDVGNVPIWEDLTGNGNNLVASSNPPVVIPSSLNGLNTLAFDATPMVFPSTFKIQPNASIYMIVKSNSVGGALQSIMGTQGITAVTGPRFYIAYHNGYLMRTQGRQTSSGVTIQDDFVVFGVRHNEVGDMVLQVNDAIVEVDGHITEYNDEVVQFGFSSYRGFKGEIGELIIFDKMLSDKEHSAMYEYLKEKWGV